MLGDHARWSCEAIRQREQQRSAVLNWELEPPGHQPERCMFINKLIINTNHLFIPTNSPLLSHHPIQTGHNRTDHVTKKEHHGELLFELKPSNRQSFSGQERLHTHKRVSQQYIYIFWGAESESKAFANKISWGNIEKNAKKGKISHFWRFLAYNSETIKFS